MTTATGVSTAHLSDEAAARRRVIALQQITLRFAGVRARITAERDAAHGAAIAGLFAVVRATMVDLDVTEAGDITGPDVLRARAVRVVCGALETASTRLQAVQDAADCAWADARAARNAERAAFDFGSGRDAA